MAKNKILFRADGNSQMGLGHIYRSLAFAEIAGNDFERHFLTRSSVDHLKEDMQFLFEHITQLSSGISIKDEMKFIAELNPAIVVTDGYQFDTDYQQQIKSLNLPLICVDDIHHVKFVADAVINHSGGISESDYYLGEHTKLFLGPSFAIIRSAFYDHPKPQRNFDEVELLILFGGADPANDTMAALRDVLAHHTYIQNIHVVVGKGYRYHDELNAFLAQNNALSKVHLYTGIGANELAAIMRKCNIAICAPSTVSFEYLTIGGALFLKQIADNQADVVKYLVDSGFAFSLNDFGKIKDSLLRDSMEKQAAVFDGKSAVRLKNILLQLTKPKLTFRKATINDMLLYFEWANDETVRSLSYNQEPISLENHKRWFENKVVAPEYYFLVFEIDKTPVGQVRIQIENAQEAVIGVSIDSNFRGRGLAPLVLRMASEHFRKENSQLIKAFIKLENQPSLRSFQKAGYKNEQIVSINGVESYRLEYN